jgi:hypothetical protein
MRLHPIASAPASLVVSALARSGHRPDQRAVRLPDGVGGADIMPPFDPGAFLAGLRIARLPGPLTPDYPRAALPGGAQ